MSRYEEVKAEHCSSRRLGLGDTGYYDQDSGAWGGHNPVSGAPAFGQLAVFSRPVSGWACYLWRHSCTGIWGSLPPLPREFKPLYLLCPLSSHCPLEVELMVTCAQVADILTGPPSPLPGHPDPSFVQNSSVQAHGTNLAPLTVLCPFSRFSLSRLPCSSRWPLIQSQAMKYKEKSVGWRGSWGDIWESFFSFIKGTGIKGEFLSHFCSFFVMELRPDV